MWEFFSLKNVPKYVWASSPLKPSFMYLTNIGRTPAMCQALFDAENASSEQSDTDCLTELLPRASQPPLKICISCWPSPAKLEKLKLGSGAEEKTDVFDHHLGKKFGHLGEIFLLTQVTHSSRVSAGSALCSLHSGCRSCPLLQERELADHVRMVRKASAEGGMCHCHSHFICQGKSHDQAWSQNYSFRTGRTPNVAVHI